MIRITVNEAEVAARLDALPGEINDALRAKMDELLARLQNYIQTEHLSAPAGFSAKLLHQRSGKLIGSIRMIPTAVSGDGLVGYVEGAGGPAWYGRVHEFGGSWAVPAREGVRRALDKRGKVLGAKTFAVKAFTVVMPERSFMRASLEEMRDFIVSEMQDAVANLGA